MSRNKTLLIWGLLGLLALLLFSDLVESNGDEKAASRIPYSEFIRDVESGKVDRVEVKGDKIAVLSRAGRLFFTYAISNDGNLFQKMYDNGVVVDVRPQEADKPSKIAIILSWLPLIFIGVFLFFLWRQMNASGNKALGFGKSKAKLMSDSGVKVTFKDVAGVDEAKEELSEIVDFLKDPKKFQKLGGKIPKGVLLFGPPGTGKTLLARAIAGEANVPFFSISGSEFVEMFVGVGASRVRDMFEQGKRNSPCIIFIDEIDAVGRHRGLGMGGGNDEREQTLNQLLVEMDGFAANDGVIIISATNRPDVLDPALLRPGRFDRQIVVSNPDLNGREGILKVHTKQLPLAENVEIRVIARGTPGFSGADLANLVNEAALIAARKDRLKVLMEDFEEARDKVLMGAERKSMVMSDEEKKLTAYHESGHALVALNMESSDPIHKVTIIPRGRSLGLVMRLPERDHVSLAKCKLEADICVAVAGRISESIIFGEDHITTGAAMDIKQATNIAHKMVTEWGMSDKVGFISYIDDDKYISDETGGVINSEVRCIIDAAYSKVTGIMEKHIDDLHKIASALLEYETLTGEEVKAILRGESIVRVKSNTEINQKVNISFGDDSEDQDSKKKPKRALKTAKKKLSDTKEQSTEIPAKKKSVKLENDTDKVPK